LCRTQNSSVAILAEAIEVFFKIIQCLNKKIQSTGKNLIWFHFSHMRFIKKTDCELYVSNGNVNTLKNTYKKNHLLLTLDFAADFLLQLNNFKFTRVAINIR